MSDWKDICHIEDILPNSGRCALHAGEQIAIFRVCQSGNDALYAVENYDPISGANVISRGIVGSQGDQYAKDHDGQLQKKASAPESREFRQAEPPSGIRAF